MSFKTIYIFQWSITRALALSALAICGQLATAQDSEPRWFEVEIIVFKDPSASGSEELWPETLKRSLPENTRDVAVEQLFPTPDNFVELSTTDSSLSTLDVSNSFKDRADTSAATEALEDQEAAFALLTEEQMQMASLFQSLKRSSRYRPLSHFGWRQPVAGKKLAEWVRIVGGTDYSSQFTLAGSSVGEQAMLREMGITTDSVSALLSDRARSENTPSDKNFSDSQSNSFQPDGSPSNRTELRKTKTSNGQSLDTATLQQPEPQRYIAVPEIDGAIQVYLSRYLHINTQLYLRKPGKTEVDIGSINASLSSSLLDLTDDGVIDSDFETGFSWSFDTNNLFEPQPNQTVMIDALQDYVMQESRRIRSGEIHYFDHPLFGIIIQVRPYDPEAEQNSTSDNSSE